tara:strand:- start:223 stop:363 length:141 start_codon:yes stop_codon:yes gene_type:complete
VVLYDVPYDAILVEVARTPRDADGLLEGVGVRFRVKVRVRVRVGVG